MKALKNLEDPAFAHENDTKLMKKPAKDHRRESGLADAPPTRVGETPSSDISNPARSSGDRESGAPGRAKSLFAYTFIAAGIVISLVWSAALFWFLLKAFMRLVA